MSMRSLLATGFALAAAVGLGCGPSSDDPCRPACGAGFQCFFAVCVPAEDASGADADADADADDGSTITPGKIDLLFVVDNSGSMAEEQAMMTGAFPVLVGALFSPPTDPGTGDPLYPAVTDLNVGVISTEMSVGPYDVSTCTRNDDGVLLHTPNPLVGGCETSYDRFLHATTATPGPDFAHDFSCIATLGTNGCGFEQPLGALDKALTVHAAPGGPNEGFLRSDAALAIVVLSDENDCSTEDTTIFDPECPTCGDLRLRCYTLASRLTIVDQFASSLNSVKPDGRFAVGLMVGVPPGVTACNTTGDAIAACLGVPAMAETIDPSTGNVRTVCESLPATRAYPGMRFVQFARLLGRNAFVQSICDPQFESFFRHLAQLAQTAD
jgi:hypothetical protein